EQTRAACVAANVDEGRHAFGPEGLEERELRLDGNGIRRDRVDDAATEPCDVAAQLDREQVGQWIEADDELAPLAFDLGCEPVAEGERRDGHRFPRVVTRNDRGPLKAALS